LYKEEIENYYSRKDVQKAILSIADNREVVPVLATGGFGSRPNSVYYEKDVEALIRQGATELHCSVERWKNPLQLSTEMSRARMEELRIGWDLIIDIDCHKGLEEAKTGALILVNALEQFGINSYSIKFSGNRGFHIGVPFEIFPESIDYKETSKMFPRLPRFVIEYLASFIEKDLRAAFKEDPKKVLTLDSQVISSRHLFRMPYCLHKKTWLASILLEKDELEGFEKRQAEIGNFEAKEGFLQTKGVEDEAVELLQAAVFWGARREKEKGRVELGEMKIPETAIGPDYFPPCIKNTLAGLEDGKKRSIFVLTTFLYNIGWKEEDIGKMLLSWNQKNKPQLRDSMVAGGFKSQFSKGKPKMSPNCKNPGYYSEYGVCTPDEFCKIINNPVTYTLNRVKRTRKRRRKKKVEKSG